MKIDCMLSATTNDRWEDYTLSVRKHSTDKNKTLVYDRDKYYHSRRSHNRAARADEGFVWYIALQMFQCIEN